ncbi:TRAP transporter substrate-binding protein [Oxalobacteraceae bacterium R-40]|uniref:TRAP transporter substrate-binding protein n=1 Tax=Keguizhuia sedimenti TaxID=3064264 RepID=A0ABU1BK72_9BURK|nr:TRAP transporter substrate-binding protein [Oxalobacteraceae bacterium R-40]
MNRFVFIFVLLAGLFGNYAACAQEPIVIKFSHVVTSDAPKGKAAEYFKRLAEKSTQGKVRVEIYPNSVLYKDREELEALQLGAVQMLAPTMAKFGPLGIKDFEVFDLPYLFPNKEALRRVKHGPVGKMLLKKLQAKGLTGLAYWDNGFKVMSANRPLKMPEDFKGLRMRIQDSRVLDAQMRALGAIPEAMVFSDVYSALQKGVIDGTENPPSNLYTQRMHEVQKHVTVSNHGYLGYAVIVNTKFWNGLPAEIRDKLEEAMWETTLYADRIAEEENARALDAVKRSGKTQVHTLTPAEAAAWRARLLPVHAELETRIGKDTVNAVKREIRRLQ